MLSADASHRLPVDGLRADALLKDFRLALRGLGYDEGINVAFVHRYGRASHERLMDQAAELVRLDMGSSSPPARRAPWSRSARPARSRSSSMPWAIR